MESIFMSISNNGVASVGTSVEASAQVEIFSQNVDKFAFAFITPLGAQNDTES